MADSNTQNPQIYEMYKPLRNRMRELNIIESLYVIWAYCNHMQFTNSKIPSDIQVDNSFLNPTHWAKRNIYEWELEVLTREVILHGEDAGSRKTLKRWDTLVNAVNTLKSIENNIGGIFVNKNNILSELFRITHRQFPWQQLRPTHEHIIRYYKIFNFPPVSTIVEQTTGLTTRQIYFLHMALLGAFTKSAKLNLPLEISLHGFTKEQANSFAKSFAKPIDDIREMVKNSQQYNDKFAYNNQSIHEYPLITFQENGREIAMCPMPTLLFWRASSGLYYKLINQPGFDKAFGESFEKYTGEVLQKAVQSKNISVIPSVKYNTGKGRDEETTDWILKDTNGLLFIECKTKRVPYTAKFELDATLVATEFEKMAKIIVQTYKSIKDYQDGHYPNLPFEKGKSVYPLVVTLEEWYVFQGDFIKPIKEAVLRLFNKESLPESWLEEMPYQICSIQEFEVAIQTINHTGIKEFMEKKVMDKEKKTWSINTFASSEFPEISKNYKPLFVDEFDALFSSFL